jgi:DNA-binding CsgD family transcriptional regulator
VVNRSRSVLRHKLVVERNLEKPSPDMPSAEHGALVSLERAAVVAALQGLTARQREAIVLRYYADLSEAEIAEAMGISRGAVKSHTSRGMAALRVALDPESTDRQESLHRALWHPSPDWRGLATASRQALGPRAPDRWECANRATARPARRPTIEATVTV